MKWKTFTRRIATARNEMKKLAAALLFSISTAASAWGPVEQAALAGVIGGVLLGKASNAQSYVPPGTVSVPIYGHQYYPQQQYYYPAPLYRPRGWHCRDIPIFDAYGRVINLSRICDYH